jgi:hypothetical protein
VNLPEGITVARPIGFLFALKNTTIQIIKVQRQQNDSKALGNSFGLRSVKPEVEP